MVPNVAAPAAARPAPFPAPDHPADTRLLHEALAALDPLVRVVPLLRRHADGTRPGSTREFEACLVTLGAVLARAHARAAARDPAPADVRPRPPAEPSLTSREQAIVALLGEGLCNKEIAARLAISLHTVKTHVHHVLAKLALRSRLEIAAFAHGGDGISVPG